MFVLQTLMIWCVGSLDYIIEKCVAISGIQFVLWLH